MNARLAATYALNSVLSEGKTLGNCLPKLLDKLDQRDRGLAQELAFGTARWEPQLSILANYWLKKPLKASDSDIKALLLVGIYQLLYMRIPAHAALNETINCTRYLKKEWAKNLLNAVLRKAQKEGRQQLEQLKNDPVITTSHPRWLQKKLKAAWPNDWEAICAANNAHPPFILRVNQQKTTQQKYLDLLQAKDIKASACIYSHEAIRLHNPCDVTQLPFFAEGYISVQDEAAQLAAQLLELQPGQNVLDACCAPGGKTCHILETEPQVSDLLALDIEPKRLTRVQENLFRLNLKATLAASDARKTDQWWNGQHFQRILLDAPCSATGVIRRHPDIKLVRQAEDIKQLAILQGELLDSLWSTLAINGIILYATCSVLPDENSHVIADFLARTPDAVEQIIDKDFGVKQTHGRQLFPQITGHDGFYYAKLKKINLTLNDKRLNS